MPNDQDHIPGFVPVETLEGTSYCKSIPIYKLMVTLWGIRCGEEKMKIYVTADTSKKGVELHPGTVDRIGAFDSDRAHFAKTILERFTSILPSGYTGLLSTGVLPELELIVGDRTNTGEREHLLRIGELLEKISQECEAGNDPLGITINSASQNTHENEHESRNKLSDRAKPYPVSGEARAKIESLVKYLLKDNTADHQHTVDVIVNLLGEEIRKYIRRGR